MDIVQIPSSLQRGITKATERLVGLTHLTTTNKPARRLGAEEDTTHQGNGRDKRRSQLQPPRQSSRILDSQIGTEPKEDTKRGPQLPGHHQRAANNSGRILCAEDGDSGCLQAHAKSKQQTGDEELGPVLGDRRPDGREHTENGGDEDDGTTTPETVQRVREPATQDGTGDVWGGVDDANDPLIALVSVLGDSKGIREGEISTIGAGLIPASD